MRAQTITTMTRRRRKARRHRALALALGVCALAVPASAGAVPIDAGPSVNATEHEDSASIPGFGTAITRSEMDKRDPPSMPGFGTAITRSETDKAEPGGLAGSSYADPAIPNATLGADGVVEPTLVTGSPASADDGFDWASGAVGAGAAMTLVALGAAALLTVRRRTTVSPAA
jgi:hypothetical protein